MLSSYKFGINNLVLGRGKMSMAKTLKSASESAAGADSSGAIAIASSKEAGKKEKPARLRTALYAENLPTFYVGQGNNSEL